MDLDSMVTNVGAVLFVVGVFVALWGRRFSRGSRKIQDIGALLAIVGIGVMASGALLF